MNNKNGYIKQQYSHFKRNELFLEENNTCERMGLLVTGTAYSYKINDNAEEVIQDFFYPKSQEILFDYESYFQ